MSQLLTTVILSVVVATHRELGNLKKLRQIHGHDWQT